MSILLRFSKPNVAALPFHEHRISASAAAASEPTRNGEAPLRQTTDRPKRDELDSLCVEAKDGREHGALRTSRMRPSCGAGFFQDPNGRQATGVAATKPQVFDKSVSGAARFAQDYRSGFVWAAAWERRMPDPLIAAKRYREDAAAFSELAKTAETSFIRDYYSGLAQRYLMHAVSHETLARASEGPVAGHHQQVAESPSVQPASEVISPEETSAAHASPTPLPPAQGPASAPRRSRSRRRRAGDSGHK